MLGFCCLSSVVTCLLCQCSENNALMCKLSDVLMHSCFLCYAVHSPLSYVWSQETSSRSAMP